MNDTRKLCPVCGKPTYSRRARYCSPKSTCRTSAWRERKRQQTSQNKSEQNSLIAQVEELRHENTVLYDMLAAALEKLERLTTAQPTRENGRQNGNNGHNGGGDSSPVLVSGNLSQLTGSGKTLPPPDDYSDIENLLEVKSVSDTPHDNGTPSATDNLIASMMRMQNTSSPGKPAKPAKSSFKNRNQSDPELIITEVSA